MLLRNTWGTVAAALGEGKCLEKMSLRIVASILVDLREPFKNVLADFVR